MMEMHEIRGALQGMSPFKVARETGLHFHTVRRIRNGENKNPSVDTVSRLSAYLKAHKEDAQ